MPVATFEQLSQVHATRVQLGASGHHWLDAECPLLVTDACRIPQHVALPPQLSQVPEPAAALLLACGLICVWLWVRRA